MVPVPEINVHVPVPTDGAFPARVTETEHKVWSAPANATDGFASTLIVISSMDGGQVPFVIVQRNTFGPVDNPFTAELADDGATTVPVPEINVHVPFPMDGIFPVNDAEEEQIV